jgi:hypothetical protein
MDRVKCIAIAYAQAQRTGCRQWLSLIGLSVSPSLTLRLVHRLPTLSSIGWRPLCTGCPHCRVLAGVHRVECIAIANALACAPAADNVELMAVVDRVECIAIANAQAKRTGGILLSAIQTQPTRLRSPPHDTRPISGHRLRIYIRTSERRTLHLAFCEHLCLIRIPRRCR